jgi:hypothetical protein
VETVVEELLESAEPSVRWIVRTGVLGEPADPELGEEIRESPRVRALLAGRGADGRVADPKQPYSKWRGAHWVLLALAELGYPAGDESLLPLRDQVLDRWLTPAVFHDARTPTGKGILVVAGRHRRCASQQGAALLAVTRLGLADERAATLVERLRHWQWPDGGWNCDKRPEARMSSVAETLLPLRGLAAYADRTGDGTARAAARKAAEVLLDRRLAWRRSTGKPLGQRTVLLRYPLYWNYDVLGALRGISEAGLLGDRRCGDALDLLESKRLPDGGWAAQGRYWSAPGGGKGAPPERVDWGPSEPGVRNEWVTAHALAVLTAAGRLAPG